MESGAIKSETRDPKPERNPNNRNPKHGLPPPNLGPLVSRSGTHHRCFASDRAKCRGTVPTPYLTVSMQSEVTLALTLTLSPRRGNRQWPRRKNAHDGESFPALEKVLPLPGGEGRGEGELEFQLHSSGLAVTMQFKVGQCVSPALV